MASQLKNARVRVNPVANARAVVEGKCPKCFRLIHRPVDSFKQLGFLCACATTVTTPSDLEELLGAAMKKSAWRRRAGHPDRAP